MWISDVGVVGHDGPPQRLCSPNSSRVGRSAPGSSRPLQTARTGAASAAGQRQRLFVPLSQRGQGKGSAVTQLAGRAVPDPDDLPRA